MPLHRALMDRDLRAVQAALREDRAAAKEFVMDDQCQTMACYATEKECSWQILAELAAHGADFNASNARGLAPLCIISEWTLAPRQGVVWLYGAAPTTTGDTDPKSRAQMEVVAVHASRVALA